MESRSIFHPILDSRIYMDLTLGAFSFVRKGTDDMAKKKRERDLSVSGEFTRSIRAWDIGPYPPPPNPAAPIRTACRYLFQLPSSYQSHIYRLVGWTNPTIGWLDRPIPHRLFPAMREVGEYLLLNPALGRNTNQLGPRCRACLDHPSFIRSSCHGLPNLGLSP